MRAVVTLAELHRFTAQLGEGVYRNIVSHAVHQFGKAT